MVNFRYHLVSIIAVFLALGIGIIMGTAVIDRAVVDRLERQQSGLRSDVDAVRSENSSLRAELDAQRDASQKLAEEGSQRLLAGTLPQVPVLVVGTRGDKPGGLTDLVTLLGRAGAAYRGTLWLTDRFALTEEREKRDLAAALGLRGDAPASTLRTMAMARLARAVRPPADPGTLSKLRAAGFVDFEPPDGGSDETLPSPDPTTRVVVVSGPKPAVPNRAVLLPLLRAVVSDRDDQSPLPVLVAEPSAVEGADTPTFVGAVRNDDALTSRVSTVDDLDGFAGRVAAVLALADLGAGRTGHYGTGPGAQRLLPAPVE